MTMSFPPKKILVPMDGSEASCAAWRSARRIGREFQSTLEVLYVQERLDIVDPNWIAAGIQEGIHAAALKKIRSWIGTGTHVKVEDGDAVKAILERIRARRPDLVVMGTHGLKGVERALLGSVTETVVRRSSVPVMAVKKPLLGIRSVLAPVHLDSKEDGTVALAAQIAAAYSAKLIVFHVTDYLADILKSRDALDGMIAKLPFKLVKACSPAPLVMLGDPIEAILTQAKSHGLIVLTARKRSLFKDWVLGTTAERILRHSPGPVITAPDAAKVEPQGKQAERIVPGFRLAGV